MTIGSDEITREQQFGVMPGLDPGTIPSSKDGLRVKPGNDEQRRTVGCLTITRAPRGANIRTSTAAGVRTNATTSRVSRHHQGGKFMTMLSSGSPLSSGSSIPCCPHRPLRGPMERRRCLSAVSSSADFLERGWTSSSTPRALPAITQSRRAQPGFWAGRQYRRARDRDRARVGLATRYARFSVSSTSSLRSCSAHRYWTTRGAAGQSIHSVRQESRHMAACCSVVTGAGVIRSMLAGKAAMKKRSAPQSEQRESRKDGKRTESRASAAIGPARRYFWGACAVVSQPPPAPPAIDQRGPHQRLMRCAVGHSGRLAAFVFAFRCGGIGGGDKWRGSATGADPATGTGSRDRRPAWLNDLIDFGIRQGRCLCPTPAGIGSETKRPRRASSASAARLPRTIAMHPTPSKRRARAGVPP